MSPTDLSNIPPEKLKENRGPSLLAGSSVVFVLATIAVILRLWARRLKRVKLGLDDWLVLAAWPFGLGLFVIDVVAVRCGLGHHRYVLAPDKLRMIANMAYALQIVWAAAIPFVKISILALYNRIFGNLHYMRFTTHALAIFTIALSITTILVCAFQCYPIRISWGPMTKGGKCIDTHAFNDASGALDLVIWMIMLFLPMPAVWSLQKRLCERISLVIIFALGGLTCAFSIVRLVELILNEANGDDTTYTGIQITIWTTAQPCLGIVCACLPTMTPLLGRIVPPSSHPCRGSRKTYFGDYSAAARTVQSHSNKGEDPYSSTGQLQSPGRLRARDGDYGFRIESRDSHTAEADTEAIRNQMGRDNEVYALTTIEVEAHQA